MLVFDFINGTCVYCNQYNTSPAWCQTCDPPRTIQGWTSGNKDIDVCIKEFQFKTTSYEDVIEWIPFNKLNNVQKVDGNILVNWIDGIRRISSENGKYVRSRASECKVTIKALPGGGGNSSDFLNEVS